MNAILVVGLRHDSTLSKAVSMSWAFMQFAPGCVPFYCRLRTEAKTLKA